jgi:alpha-galactosidase
MARTFTHWLRGAAWATVILGAASIAAFAQSSQLARTPPMGWNDCFKYACSEISDRIMRANTDALVNSGMKAAGYKYMNLDGCWQGKRDEKGFLHPNDRFPDMKALADYIHSKGLKFGLYSSPGPKDCEDYEGSFGHEDQDAQTFAAWGVDFLKYDWCGGDTVYKPEEMPAAYRKMYDAIGRTGRPMVYSLCQYGMRAVWRWGAAAGANMWRTTDDIAIPNYLGGNYDQVTLVGFQQDGLGKFAGPGHWNDPDILQIGVGKMDHDEERTQMALWCILAAPLLAGNDLTKMTKDTLEILTNPEVIAVDQDRLGVQGHRVWQEGSLEVWMKPLADGSKAVGLFNRGRSELAISVEFGAIGAGHSARVRDLWARKDLGTFAEKYTANVPRHGAVLIKVKAAGRS